jgi:hypothetical protein
LEFGNHLKNLLYLYDCIIVPGLGGFVARYYPARLDGLRRKVKPPTKEFFFDDSLVKDGDILVSFISRVKGIEMIEARQIVERFASETKDIVKQGDRAELPGLGWFYKGAKGRIQFEFELVNNFHPETAGLPELNLPEFHKSEKTVMSETTEENTPVAKKPTPLRHLAWMVPLIIFASALVWIAGNWDSVKKQKFVSDILYKIQSGKGARQNLPPTITLGVPDSASLVEQAIDTISSMKNALIPGSGKEKNIATDKYANCSRFYIIAGSFKRMKNADELSKQLTLEGYKTEILSSADGMYRVSVMVFMNRPQALKILDKIKAEGKLRNVWLLSI